MAEELLSAIWACLRRRVDTPRNSDSEMSFIVINKMISQFIIWNSFE